MPRGRKKIEQQNAGEIINKLADNEPLKEVNVPKTETEVEVEQLEQATESIVEEGEVSEPLKEESIIEEKEELISVEGEKVTKKEFNELLFIESLSPNAKKWYAWIKMHGLTSSKFLEKYKNHPSRSYIEEIYENEKNINI